MNRAIVLLTVLIAAATARPASAADLRLTPVLLGGEPARGIGPAGSTIEELAQARLNDRGDVAVLVTVRDPRTGKTSRGVMTGKPGALATLLADGAPTPGLAGSTLAVSRVVDLDPAGNVLVASHLTGPNDAFNTFAYHLGRPGSLLPVTLPGRKIPGTALPGQAGATRVLDDGRVVVHVDYPSGLHVFVADVKKNQFTRLATPGQPLPGSGDPGTFRSFDDLPVANARGEFLFATTLEPPGGPTAAPPVQSLWFGTPDRLTRVIGTGDPVPGVPGRTVNRFMIRPALGDAGHLVVGVTFQGDPPATALLTGKPGALELVASSDTPAPGLPATSPPRTLNTGTFAGVDNAGRLLWSTIAYHPSGKSVTGTWLFADGKLALVGTESADRRPEPVAPVTGLPPGETCTPTSLPGRLTAAGDWLGIGKLSREDPASNLGTTLVRYRPDTGWAVLARAGQVIPLAGRRGTTVQAFSWVGPPNASGQFLAVARLDNVRGDVLLLGQLPTPAADATAKP